MIRLTLFFALISAGLFAQNAALMPQVRNFYAYDNASGQPLAGGFVYTCVSGSPCTSATVGGIPSNPQPTYTDSTATSALPNPVVLDAAGSATIWGLDLPYKIVVENYAGVVQYTADNVTPPGPFGVVGNTNPLYVNLALQNGAVPNSPTTCNDAAFTAAIASAQTGPGFVLVPAGTWYTCSTIVIPNGVMIAGPGHWSQEPEFGTVQNAVVKAGSTFSVGSGYQAFMFVLGGTTGSDTYGSRLEQMSVDASGIADGVYIGQANEHSGMAFVDILNFPHYGIYSCGADNGGPCGTNMPNGAQGDGDYHDIQLTPNTSYGMTNATVPLFLNNLTGSRAWRNFTIDPVGGTTNQPNYGVVAWGTKWTLDNIHIQNIRSAGFLISPFTSPCPGVCNGTLGATLSNLDVTQPAVNGVYVVQISNATAAGINLSTISSDGNAACLISYNLSSGYSGCVGGSTGVGGATNVWGFWWIDQAGIPMSFGTATNFQQPIFTHQGVSLQNGTNITGNLTMGSAIITSPSSTVGIVVGQQVSGTAIPAGTTLTTLSPLTMSATATSNETATAITFQNPQITLEGPGPTFAYNYLQGTDTGDFIATKNVSGTGWLFNSAYSPLAIYQGNKYNGLNLMGSIGETANLATRTQQCSNLYWVHGTGLWTVGGNGGTDYACLLALQNGFGLSVSGTAATGAGTTLTNTNVLNNLAWVTNYTTGHTLFGGGLVNTSTGAINDHAGTVQTPSLGDQNSGNGDLSGTLTFSSSSTSNTYTFSAAGANVPVCVLTGNFVNGYVYAVYGGSSPNFTLTAHSNTSNSGSVGYICVLKP